MTRTSERIIVGLSGGVDSAVTALRLLEQGHRVEGLFMKNWEDDDSTTACTAADDLASARQVCGELGIPLHQANFAARYREEVFEHCLREYRAGRTPNPDVLCNRHIKFRAFLDHARRLGADAVATGHYAAIGRDGDRVTLRRAVDGDKDQTYFLHALDQSQLAAARFPLADLQKTEVRAMAADAGFDNFDRPDSTGICFIGERDFRGFLARYIPVTPGPIVTPEGDVLGEHRGLAFHTIGQRRGLDLGGRAGYDDRPWYVADKDRTGNQLIVVQGHDHPSLLSESLTATDVHWIAGTPPALPRRLTARIRYRQADQTCLVAERPGGDVTVRFDVPQRAVAPGQSVVFYDGPVCLGGGVIDDRTAATEGLQRASA